MENTQVERLKIHILHIANNFINQLSEEDVIYSKNENGDFQTDAVANHHLIDFLSELNPSIFWHYCESMFSWLASNKSQYQDHPFTLDSYTKFCPINEENTKLFQTKIVDHQLKDGAIPIYTSYISGGDFFSTLWAVKILINYDIETFRKEIKKSIHYLIEKEKIAARTTSQKGFLLFLLLKFEPNNYKNEIELIFNDLFNQVKKLNFNESLIDTINHLYLIEDIIEYYDWCKSHDAKALIEKKFISLFELNKEPELPELFRRLQDILPQSPYFQLLIKSGVIATKYLQTYGSNGLALELNSHLHSQYRQIKYIGIKNQNLLRKYKKQYDEIEEAFKFYDEHLEKMWDLSDSEYDNSIFLMMPFKSDLEYRELTKSIKNICSKLGFNAFRVDDNHRSPFDTSLWDNIVLNMLGCKYGISVYVSEKGVDKMTDELRFFQNPNVALEFGFMKSRGKKVLFLKDEKSVTPSDLQGFMWKSFDIKNPDKTVPNAVEEWLKEIKALNNTD